MKKADSNQGVVHSVSVHLVNIGICEPAHHECQFVIDKYMKIGYHVKVDIAVIP